MRMGEDQSGERGAEKKKVTREKRERGEREKRETRP
jgi:hypothetical protein